MNSRLSSVVRSSRGSAGQEYVIAAVAIGLSGLLGMQSLGGSMGQAIAEDAVGAPMGMLTSRQAGTDVVDVGKGNGETSSVKIADLSDEQIVQSLARTKDALKKAKSNKERASLEAGVLSLRQEQTRRGFADKSDRDLQDLKAEILKTLALRRNATDACAAGKPTCPNDIAFGLNILDGINVEVARRADLANMPNGGSNSTTGNGKFVPSTGATDTTTKTGTNTSGKSLTSSGKDPLRPSVLVSPEEARQSAMGAAVDGTMGGVEGAVDFAWNGVSGLFTPVKWLFWDTWHGADIPGDIKRFVVGAFKSPAALIGAIRDSGYECLAGDESADERGNACGHLGATLLTLGGGGWKGTKYAKLVKQAENLEALAKEAGVMGKLGKLAVKFSDTKWGASIGEWWRTKRGAAAAKAADEADVIGPGAEIGVIKHEADGAATTGAAADAAATAANAADDVTPIVIGETGPVKVEGTALASTKLERLLAEREGLVSEHNALFKEGVAAQAKASASGLPFSEVISLPELKAMEKALTRLQRRVETLDGKIAAEKARP